MGVPVIAIDGPSAVGKSTIAHRLADALQFNILISGALYRIVGMQLHKKQIKADDSQAVKKLIASLDIQFELASDKVKILLNGNQVEDEIINEDYAIAASQVSEIAELRKAMLPMQQRFRRLPGLIADGRDMGTIVFPDAFLKIFLRASLEERVERRYKQLKQHGVYVTLQNLKEEILERDQRDIQRTVAPLKVATDAVVFDTTQQAADDTVVQLTEIVKTKLNS